MSVSRRERLAADLALGLTCYLLPSPWRVGDVRLTALGRLFLWPGWDSLEDDRRVRVAAFLSLRPDALGEQRSLESVLRLVLAEETSFVVEASDADEPFWQRRYLPRPGKPLEQRLDEWLVGLRELRVYRPGIAGVERPGEGEVTLETWSGVGARIPVAIYRTILTHRLCRRRRRASASGWMSLVCRHWRRGSMRLASCP